MIFFIQILSLLFSITGTVILAFPFLKVRRALEDDLLIDLEKNKEASNNQKHFYTRAGFLKDRRVSLWGLIFLLLGFLLQLFILIDPKISILSYNNCNVQNIKLHGQLYTYKNAASDNSGQASKDIASSEEIVRAINNANSDNSIKAIILEIDSGGGSPVAGEEVATALKKSKKPTVALIRGQGDSAAYLSATGANYIIASDDSDVGSIGVTMSYVDNANKNEQDGLTFDQLSIGKFKDAGDPDKSLTAEEKALFDRDLKILYSNFIKTVSTNRNLDISKVTALADGSSMLGQMAKENGLIDKVGNIYDAESYLQKQIKTNINICW
jgi:signal peptide peptidase SppA